MRDCQHRRWWGALCLRCTLITLGFPIEHVIWEKLPAFRNITHLLGL